MEELISTVATPHLQVVFDFKILLWRSLNDLRAGMAADVKRIKQQTNLENYPLECDMRQPPIDA